MRRIRFAVAVLAAVTAAAAWADVSDVKPGLWERTVVMQVANPPPMPDLSKLPPEQRAHVEKMMAPMPGKPTTLRECVTPEMAKEWKHFAKDDREDPSCTRKVLESSPKHVEMALECAKGPSSGTLEFTAESPEHVVGTISMVHGAGGTERRMNMRIDSHWLGAECGDVMPDQPQRHGDG